MSVKVEDIEVTPDMAKDWLENHNPTNRKISPSNVNGYARDMMNGAWEFTADPIQFDENGDLLNGQHRLLAVIESGCTILFHVVSNLPTQARKYMDTGRKRTVGDILSIEGSTHGKLLAAAMRLYIDVENYRRPNAALPSSRASSAEVVNMVQSDETIQWVGTQVQEIPQKMLNRTVACYAYWTLHKIDPYLCAEFFKRLVTPANMDERSPIMALHKRLTVGNWNEYRGTRLKIAQVAVVFLAWNAWRYDQKRTLVKVPKTQDNRISIPEPI